MKTKMGSKRKSFGDNEGEFVTNKGVLNCFLLPPSFVFLVSVNHVI